MPTGRPPQMLYVGSYRRGGGEGIYGVEFDAERGEFGKPRLAARTPDPSFLIRHARQPVVYAVNEVRDRADGGPGGSVTAFAVDPTTGGLHAIGACPSAGALPCHLAVEPSGGSLWVANYGGASVARLNLAPTGEFASSPQVRPHLGSSAHPFRQSRAHPHGVYVSPSGRWLVVPDLGCDRIFIYDLNAGAASDPISTLELQPGDGPRHLAFAPDATQLYVVNELTCTVVAFAWNESSAEGRVVERVSLLPANYEGDSSAAEIALHPNGRWVFASVRGADTLVTFAVNAAGAPRLVRATPSGGRTPRHFAIDPTGRWCTVAIQDSGEVALFSLQPESGALVTTGKSVSVPMPACVLW